VTTLNNIEIVNGWLKLAIEDWNAAKRMSIEENRGAIVFHLQQFVEKVTKAIIAALGYEPPKTHNPSRDLENILLDISAGEIKLDIRREIMNDLKVLISIAKTFEDEKTRPRYGVRHAQRIITPNEYYSPMHVKLFLEDAKFIAKLSYKILNFLKMCRGEECEKLRTIGEDP